MTEKEAIETVESINDYIASRLWFDFDLITCDPYMLKVGGGIDPSAAPELVVEFGDIFFVSMPTTWRHNTSQPFLRLLQGAGARELNLLHRIEQGYHLFVFRPEDAKSDYSCLIVAKTIALTRAHA